MGPSNIPPDAGAHLNLSALPGFLVWAAVIAIMIGYAWYLEKGRNDDEEHKE